MKTYVTFGQIHRHEIDGIIYDKDCVAVIDAPTAETGRNKAFELFGHKFCFEYPEEHFNISSLDNFPRGLIPV